MRWLISCLMACAWLAGGCELENANPHIIAGPSVPSPVPLQAPYVWDARDELVVWIENAVSRGSFSIDDDGSNGAIVIQLTAGSSATVLRGPDVVPPARSIGAVRIRYRWLSNSPSDPGPSVSVSFDATNVPSADLQPSGFATPRTGPDWKDLEFTPYLRPLDVRYVYFSIHSVYAGLLKIDTIAFVS
jgi:hypothetical protein